MNLDENKLAEVLRSQFQLSDELLKLASMWHRERGGSLADILIEMRAVTEEDMRKAIGIVCQGGEKLARGSAAHLTFLHDLGFTIHLPEDAQGRCLNISSEAFRVIMDQPPRVGARMSVELRAPGGTRLTCDCLVRNARRVQDQGVPRHVVELEPCEISVAQKFALDAIVNEAKRLNDDLENLEIIS